MLKSIYNSQRKGKENKNSHVNYSAIKTLSIGNSMACSGIWQ